MLFVRQEVTEIRSIHKLSCLELFAIRKHSSQQKICNDNGKTQKRPRRGCYGNQRRYGSFLASAVGPEEESKAANFVYHSAVFINVLSVIESIADVIWVKDGVH